MNKTNLWIDLGIFAAFLLIMDPGLTGLAIHEWLSVAFAAAAVAHLLLHWDWLVCVGGKFFRKLWQVSRLKFVVDVLLFAAVVLVMLSGLLISRSVLPLLGLTASGSRSWQSLHRLSADASLYLMALHFALNWGWVKAMFKKVLLTPLAGLFKRRPAPAALEVEPAGVETHSLSNNR